MLAENGYAAFAVDLYGQGVRPDTVEESRGRKRQAVSRPGYHAYPVCWAGLKRAGPHDGLAVDPDRVVAIGYCFGRVLRL